jgi:hypothetical protein
MSSEFSRAASSCSITLLILTVGCAHSPSVAPSASMPQHGGPCAVDQGPSARPNRSGTATWAQLSLPSASRRLRSREATVIEI